MRSTPPRPGPVHGLYPQRADRAEPGPGAHPWHQHLQPPLGRRLAGWLPRRLLPLREAQRQLPALRSQQAAWAALHPALFALQRDKLRARLARDGWQPLRLRNQALACAAAALQQVLQRQPYDTQLLCAQLLLQGQLAEMATGEGKTLAVALAAAVAGLAGVPVHVMTANDYLVQRDAALLQPYFAVLGLKSGCVLGDSSEAQRRAAYACDITHCTAREVAFDHLRDRQRLLAAPAELQQRAARLCSPEAPQPVLRGLCMALVDEADSLLVDEATLPLVLAQTENNPDHRARCVQALALARELQAGQQVQVQAGSLNVVWTAEALQAVAERSAPFGPAWHHAAERQETVAQALVALHGLQRDSHYLVREGRVELLDAVTGRSAHGRVWQHGLQTLVELKEGCKLSPQTRSCAQTSYQRFFARYWCLAGTSGTLAECRRELRRVYGLQVVQLPLRTQSQRRQEATRRFVSDAERSTALAQRVRALQAAGRPVLIGVATVAQAQTVAASLAQAGVLHRVLDARHDAQEAAVIAAAGQPGAVTVATAMAGRGTDIALGPGVATAGGLHVLLCQDNRCARLDRQFIGRAGRQGEPGSAEIWLAAAHAAGPSWWLGAAHALRQRWHNRQETQRRRRLLEQELAWQKQLHFTQLHA